MTIMEFPRVFMIVPYDNHGVSKSFYDSAAVGLKTALEKLDFPTRLLTQAKPTHHGGLHPFRARGTAWQQQGSNNIS